MPSLMCLGCGEFVRAHREDDALVPFEDRRPSCDGSAFRDNRTGERVQTAAGTD